MQRAGSRGSRPRSHGVCQKQALWNWIVGHYQPLTPPPKYQGAGRVERLGGGEPNRGNEGDCTSVCRQRTSKVNLPATGGTFTNEVHEGLNKYMEILFQCEKRYFRSHLLFFPGTLDSVCHGALLAAAVWQHVYSANLGWKRCDKTSCCLFMICSLYFLTSDLWNHQDTFINTAAAHWIEFSPQCKTQETVVMSWRSQ